MGIRTGKGVSRPSSSRPSSSGGSRPSSSGGSRPGSSRPSGSGGSRPSGGSSRPSTADNMLSGGPNIKERPYVNPNVPPNKPLPPTPSSKPSNRPSSSSKPDAETGAKPKDGKNKPKRNGPDADTIIDATEVAIYGADVLAEDEQFTQEGGATNNNNNEAPRQEETRPREPPKEDEDPVTKPLEEKVKNNGLQQPAQNQIASETGDSGVGEREYLEALSLVNRYEQYGCSKKNKPNPVNQPPKRKSTGVANF